MTNKFVGPVLEIIAEGYFPVRNDGACDLTKLNFIMLHEAKKRDLTVNIKYSSDENRYEFKIYGEEK